MRVVTLRPSYDDSESVFKSHDPPCDPAPFCTGGASSMLVTVEELARIPKSHKNMYGGWDFNVSDGELLKNAEFFAVAIHKKTVGQQLRDLVSLCSVDVFLNLCDGAWDEDRPGVDVVHVLERLNVPFTGACSWFYEPTRESMKMVCRYWGVKTPEYVICRRERDADMALAQLQFPLIVKHENSYGSVGMTKNSKVNNQEDLRAEVKRFCTEFGSAMVEEFIEGSEFTCLVAESLDEETPDAGSGVRCVTSYQSVRCEFPPGETFKHFHLKWEGFDGMVWKPCEDSELDRRIREATSLLFRGLNGTGYGRADVRVNSRNEVYVLEINPNCGVFYPQGSFGSADEILDRVKGHTSFIATIIRCAFNQWRKRQPLVKLNYIPNQGYEMLAAVSFRPGQVIQVGEGQKLAVASTRHTNSWVGIKQKWFEQYAYPISENVHVLWDDHPTGWKPINHSCDPNAWMLGLDMVARKPISPDEPITIDYATFCGANMMEFDCSCKSALCRKRITGNDALRPELQASYAGHFSPFVESWQKSENFRLLALNK